MTSGKGRQFFIYCDWIGLAVDLLLLLCHTKLKEGKENIPPIAGQSLLLLSLPLLLLLEKVKRRWNVGIERGRQEEKGEETGTNSVLLACQLCPLYMFSGDTQLL